jgi:hypothetical protein
MTQTQHKWSGTWDISELDRLIDTKFGEVYGKEFRKCSRSVSKKIEIAVYHYFQAIGLLHGDACLHTGGKNDDTRWSQAVIAAEANIIAYAHSMHSCIELFATLVVRSLKLTEKKKINIYNVTAASHNFPTIQGYLSAITDSAEFIYLRAFVNSQKHIEFIGTSYWIGLYKEGKDDTYGLKIDGFAYKDDNTPKTDHPEKFAFNFVANEFVFLKDSILRCGNELNNLVNR